MKSKTRSIISIVLAVILVLLSVTAALADNPDKGKKGQGKQSQQQQQPQRPDEDPGRHTGDHGQPVSPGNPQRPEKVCDNGEPDSCRESTPEPGQPDPVTTPEPEVIVTPEPVDSSIEPTVVPEQEEPTPVVLTDTVTVEPVVVDVLPDAGTCTECDPCELLLEIRAQNEQILANQAEILANQERDHNVLVAILSAVMQVLGL